MANNTGDWLSESRESGRCGWQCDIISINCPLQEKTRGLFNKELIAKMKKRKIASVHLIPQRSALFPMADRTVYLLGSWIVNTARGAIVVAGDIAAALKSGHLRGCGGDVWFPQPASGDHVLRYTHNPLGGGNTMVPHMSGSSLDGQKRYAEGTKRIIESYLSGRHDYNAADLILYRGDYATRSYGQRQRKWWLSNFLRAEWKRFPRFFVAYKMVSPRMDLMRKWQDQMHQGSGVIDPCPRNSIRTGRDGLEPMSPTAHKTTHIREHMNLNCKCTVDIYHNKSYRKTDI
jgi:hypothetical protein